MKKLSLMLIAILMITVFACKKKEDTVPDNKPDYTPLVGDWIDFASTNVEMFSITGRGTIISVNDTKVNLSTLNEGKLHLYIKHSNGANTNYFHLPNTIVGLNNVRLEEFKANGSVLMAQSKPTLSSTNKLEIRGIVIPSGKTLPSTVDTNSYSSMATYFSISN